MEVKYIFLHPPSIEEILYSTPLIRSLIKSVEQSEIISAVPASYSWALENNPYISELLVIDKPMPKLLNSFKDLKADYLVDLTGGKKLGLFKNRLRVMDFTLHYKKINELHGIETCREASAFYMKAGLDLLSVFDLEDVDPALDLFYGHNKTFVQKALPESFLGNYAVLDMPDEHENEDYVVDKLSELISMIERPIVMCGIEKWRMAGEEIMRRTGCIMISTIGDFSEQGYTFIKAEANVLINIEKHQDLWSMVFNRPHFFIDISNNSTEWRGQIHSIRNCLSKHDR